jgi:hypothetical protein
MIAPELIAESHTYTHACVCMCAHARELYIFVRACISVLSVTQEKGWYILHGFTLYFTLYFNRLPWLLVVTVSPESPAPEYTTTSNATITSLHDSREAPLLHSPSTLLGYVSTVRRSRGAEEKTQIAIMMQVGAARNSNAIVMAFRECLHKCLLPGDGGGRCRGLSANRALLYFLYFFV